MDHANFPGEIWVVRAGELPYPAASSLQTALAGARHRGEIADVVLLLEHPPVFTRGRRTPADHLPMGAGWYRERGIAVHETDRGGQVTYHGPGQLVAYPIIELTGADQDLHAYVRRLERVMIAALADAGVPAQVFEGLTGVWTAGSPPIAPGTPGPQRTPVGPATLDAPGAARKIGSIGIHVSHWVTTHGLAINVDCDLAPFGWAVPCGIDSVDVTSIERETGASPGVAAVADSVARHLCAELRRRPVERELEYLAGVVSAPV